MSNGRVQTERQCQSRLYDRMARMSGLHQVRLTAAVEPLLTQTRVDRFLSTPWRVDVGMIGGEMGDNLGNLGNGPAAGAGLDLGTDVVR